MKSPIGLAMGAVIYLSWINISHAASYDVNPVANLQMDGFYSSQAPGLASSEFARKPANLKHSFSSVQQPTFLIKQVLSEHHNKQYNYLLMVFLGIGFYFLTISRRPKAKYILLN